MFLGVDCGTQGTKVVLCDSKTNKVVGSGYGKHDIISNQNGRKEQHVQWWIDAFKFAFNQAINQVANNSATSVMVVCSQIKAIGVSGQQHGMVVLDEADHPLYPAKLWCDTESHLENEEIIQAFGGNASFIAKTGIQLQTGYTASKILWLRKHRPELFAHVAKIMLPHDYINYWLTGEFVTEFGDASGTGYLNIVTRQYDTEVFSILAPNLSIEQCLPKLIRAQEKVGMLKPEIANELGLQQETLVSSGGGDNMMGAIGTGNIEPGIVTMSLGTSGTLYAYNETPMPNSSDMIANFCSSSNGWLPLICTMNVTASTTLMQNLFGTDLESFTRMLKETKPGADGITLLPFFNGERVPPLPNATASLHGLTSDNVTPANILRATTEAVTFTIRYGLDLFRQQGMQPTEIRLIGGGAKNPQWRQLVADMMNTPVICPLEHEAAALGAAIQSMWTYHHEKGDDITLKALCNKWVNLDDQTITHPIEENVVLYESAYQTYKQYLKKIYGF